MEYEVENDSLETIWGKNRSMSRDPYDHMKELSISNIKKIGKKVKKTMKESQWRVLYKFENDTEFVEADINDREMKIKFMGYDSDAYFNQENEERNQDASDDQSEDEEDLDDEDD